MKVKKHLYFILILFSFSVFSQSKLNQFLKPSDSLNVQRRNTVIISESVVSAGVLIGLNQLWYADYPKSNFHFINDNNEWLQMDKVGHVYSSYQLGRFSKEAFQWSGVSPKNQLIYGSTLGFVFLSAVEVLDGFSSEWGASVGDIVANATGTALYVSQELLWKEQRISPKFSFHNTQYPAYNPAILGSNLQQQVLKDYNGQTYWLSANLYSFRKDSKMPKWLNFAIGYGAEGMISGDDTTLQKSAQNTERYRQFYFSLDADLTKIQTKSHFLKTFLSILNTIKIPSPTIEISSEGSFKFHYLYF